ncbi:C-type mannose receptor 2-like, partial [Silurus meridionalis]
TGFIPFTLSIPRKYYLIQQGKIWSDAQTYCRATHTDLATIEDTKNMIRVQYVTQSENFNSSAWIGLSNDVKSWRWSMGNQPLGSFYTWYGTNPDNWKGKETCGAIAPWGWLDCPCPNLYPFVCYDGFIPFTLSIPHKYYLIQQGKIWSDAQTYCRATHTDLATIEDAKNMIRVQYVTQSENFNSSAWIGLSNDVNSWHWSMGNQPLGSFYTWFGTNPDNWKGKEACVTIAPSGWYDCPCANVYPFVCYDGFIPFTLSIPRKYYLIQQGKIWSDAQTYCRATHTDLATIEDAKNMIRVQYVAQSENFKSSAWIGLSNDVNSWHWSMGNQPLGSFYTWFGTNPDNWKGKEACVTIAPSGWYDCPCANVYPFVCYDGNEARVRDMAGRHTGVFLRAVTLPVHQILKASSTDDWSIRNEAQKKMVPPSKKGADRGGLVEGTIAHARTDLRRETWKVGWMRKTLGSLRHTALGFITLEMGNRLMKQGSSFSHMALRVVALCSCLKPFYCLTGFISFTLSIPRKYYLIHQGKRWSDAQTYCRTTHTDLATIEDAKNMVRVQYVTQSKIFNSSAWIGLSNDVNSWHWSMGNQPLGSFYMWFAPNPDNWNGVESCGAIAPWGWNDSPCSKLLPFVCYNATKSTGQYIYFSSLKNWSDAQSYCRQYHTDLASAKTSTENSIIKAMISDDTWFGLFRDSWKWSDGTIFTSIPMMPGQPDNLLKNENCMALTNSEASDELCSDIKPFFCYSCEFHSLSY